MKLVFGLLAIAANVYCVWLVFGRAAAANEGDWDEFARLDHKQHKYGAATLLAIIVALAIGVYALSLSADDGLVAIDSSAQRM